MLIGVPDKILAEYLKNKNYIIASDEGEAIGIGAGYWIATKEPATVFMSADGFCNALNPLTSFIIPYGIKIKLLISTGRQELPHKIMTDNLEAILKIIKYDPEKVDIAILK